MGQSTTFYLEGGHGQNYWAGGWHLGTIRALPTKGQKKGFAQVELACTVWGWSDGRGHNRNGTPLSVAQAKAPRGSYRREGERYWVNAFNLNEPGDTTYHGPRLNEVVAERQEAKEVDQAKAEAAKRVSVSRQHKQARPSVRRESSQGKRQAPNARRSKAA